METSEYGFRFQNWEVYREARSFRVFILGIVNTFPVDERFVLKDQARRALGSIILNIAEGANRRTDRDMVVFINRSRTSLDEVVAILDCALDDAYLSEAIYRECLEKASVIAKMLNRFTSRLSK